MKFYRSPSPISCSKQGQLKEVAQAPVQSNNMDGKSTPFPISLWAPRNHVLLSKPFKCSWRFFWWHQQAPVALWDGPHQVLWTSIYHVYLNISVWLTKRLFSVFLEPGFPSGQLDLGLLKETLTSKDQGRETASACSASFVTRFSKPLILHPHSPPHFSLLSFCCWYTCTSLSSCCPSHPSPDSTPLGLWLS